MVLIAEREKETEPSFWLVQKIIFACFCFFLGWVALYYYKKNSSIIVFCMGFVLILFGVLFICFGIKNYISDKLNNKLSNEILLKHYNNIIFVGKEEIKININEIKEVKAKGYLKFYFSLFRTDYGVLKIRTTNTKYTIHYVKDVKKVAEELKNDIIKNK